MTDSSTSTTEWCMQDSQSTTHTPGGEALLQPLQLCPPEDVFLGLVGKEQSRVCLLTLPQGSTDDPHHRSET